MLLFVILLAAVGSAFGILEICPVLAFDTGLHSSRNTASTSNLPFPCRRYGHLQCRHFRFCFRTCHLCLEATLAWFPDSRSRVPFLFCTAPIIIFLKSFSQYHFIKI